MDPKVGCFYHNKYEGEKSKELKQKRISLGTTRKRRAAPLATGPSETHAQKLSKVVRVRVPFLSSFLYRIFIPLLSKI